MMSSVEGSNSRALPPLPGSSTPAAPPSSSPRSQTMRGGSNERIRARGQRGGTRARGPSNSPRGTTHPVNRARPPIRNLSNSTSRVSRGGGARGMRNPSPQSTQPRNRSSTSIDRSPRGPHETVPMAKRTITFTSEMTVTPGSDPRSTFRDMKNSQNFVSDGHMPKVPLQNRPWRQSEQIPITSKDIQFKLKSSPFDNTPVPQEKEKLKLSSSYPDRIGTHTLLSVNEPFRGNRDTFDDNIRTYLQSISEVNVRLHLSNRLFSSRNTCRVATETVNANTSPIPLRRTRSATTNNSNRSSRNTPHMSSPVSASVPVESGIVQNEEWEALLEEKEEDIIFTEPDGLIKGGTIESIVRTITNPKFSSPSCLNAFLLTYRAFATPVELLNLLIARFHVKSSRSKDPEFKKYFEERKRKPIQLRTGNCIRRWLDNHWYDFESNDELLNALLAWIRGPLSRSKFGTLPKTLENLVEKKRAGGPRGGIKFSDATPSPIIPKTENFLDFKPKEVARQLALIEFQDYVRIHPTECMHQSWTKPDKDKLSPHIGRMIKRSNTVPMWLATQILSHTEQKVKLRAKMITMFIKIAKECNKLNNFNAVMEIIAGLSLSPIHRLGKSWELVPKKYLDTLNQLKEMMCPTGNWGPYRATLKQRDPPCLPYFGMYLTDLTFIEDGHPDYIEGSPNCINFIKCRQMAVVIQDIQQYQQKSYSFRDVPVIQSYLLELKHQTDDELYAVSLEVEPRH